MGIYRAFAIEASELFLLNGGFHWCGSPRSYITLQQKLGMCLAIRQQSGCVRELTRKTSTELKTDVMAQLERRPIWGTSTRFSYIFHLSPFLLVSPPSLPNKRLTRHPQWDRNGISRHRNDALFFPWCYASGMRFAPSSSFSKHTAYPSYKLIDF